MEALISIIVLVLLIGFGFKYRIALLQWLNSEPMPEEDKRQLKRLYRAREDLQEDIAKLEAKDIKDNTNSHNNSSPE